MLISSTGKEKRRRKELLKLLSGFSVNEFFKLTPEIEKNPYKYFSALLLGVIALTREFGSSPKESLMGIKKALILDDHFERKLSDFKNRGFLQFFMMMVLTWGFIFISSRILETNLSTSMMGLIIFLEVAGLFCFSKVFSYLKSMEFRNFEDYFCSLYQINSLLMVGTPISVVVERSRIVSVIEIKDRKFHEVNDLIKNQLSKIKRDGHPSKQEIEHIIEEVWFLRNQIFENFIKKAGGYHLLVLSVFFLSGYLLYLYSLMKAAL